MPPEKRILTCALTGGDANSIKSGIVPITPEQIANSAIDAWRAGASIVHIHVREPATGRPSMQFELYEEVVGRIRRANCDAIINLTTGPGARLMPGPTKNSLAPDSNLCTPEDRVSHIIRLKPEMCSLDTGSLNYSFGGGVFVNDPTHVFTMADGIVKAGTKPELEIFELGHVGLAKQICERHQLQRPYFQFVLGLATAAPANAETLLALTGQLPPGAIWAAFGVGRHQFRMLAQAYLMGGHLRVGLEDNLYLQHGKLAPGNGALVEKAVRIVRDLGGDVASSNEARETLGLVQN